MNSRLSIKMSGVEIEWEGGANLSPDDIVEMVKELSQISAVAPAIPSRGPISSGQSTGTPEANGHEKRPLPTFLTELKASTSQVKRFLATAVWLHDAKDVRKFKTVDVTSALKDANQKRLSNPSDCLRQNVEKGYIEKDSGSVYYVTSEGRTHLGV